MIGQKTLLKHIDKLIEEGFPQFVIITGVRGSGKKVLASYIASKTAKVSWTLEDNKIANIRQMIQMSYNNYQSTLCIIPDADTLSIPAQNAVLKIIEEPPKNTYFIMTVEDINYVLPTIKSRAFVLNMGQYTHKELCKYMPEEYVEYCNVPGDYDILKQYDLQEFLNFVDKVKNNVGTASIANVFKLSNEIALSVESNGYDLETFFRVFIMLSLKGRTTFVNLRMALKTSQFMKDLRVRGINKTILFNDWIIRMREIYECSGVESED